MAVAVARDGLLPIFLSSIVLIIIHFFPPTLRVIDVASSNASPDDPGKFIFGPGFHGGENLAPWAYDLFKFSPTAAALGPAASGSEAEYIPLVLGEKRTARPHVLNNLRLYRGGWNITNKHYWASVGITGAAGFVLGGVWFISFPLALGVLHCCRWRIGIWEKDSGILLLMSSLAEVVGKTKKLHRSQLVTALNVTYAFDHYAPFVLNLKNCNFVRETFNWITTNHCVHLELDLRLVNAGLALVASGVMLGLVLWLFSANRLRRKEVFQKSYEVKMSVVSQTPTRTEAKASAFPSYSDS